MVDLIATIRQSASLLRADHVTLRRAQLSNSDRMLRTLTDVRCRVAVRDIHRSSFTARALNLTDLQSAAVSSVNSPVKNTHV